MLSTYERKYEEYLEVDGSRTMANLMNELIERQPARIWTEAFPVGNGRIGAMLFGGVSSERIGLNEDSIWYGVRSSVIIHRVG
ncbi:glycoside hydrolase N-terminal domain-containing protein [Paenibacillus sp. D2_2]|nr:glycoside hydrolase N-terminal domain-containing protein [Paenibacillus sp. D2_2]WMT39047.1 glycoside hydrolase N-terminal domain-containing protein [Paenibacillus sp. D2_2]